MKLQASDDSKSEYALELQKTNQAQRDHYETVMPQIYQVCLRMCYSELLMLFSSNGLRLLLAVNKLMAKSALSRFSSFHF